MKSDVIMIENFGNLQDPFLWELFDKDAQDFTMEDMNKLRFKTLELYGEFYKFYAKIKGFVVMENNSCKSRIDGHHTSRIYKCSNDC